MLDKVKDTVQIDSQLNGSIKEVIAYHLKNGLPMNEAIEIRVRRQGKLLTEGINYKVDYNNEIIYFNNKDFGFYTYSIMICINIRYINELIKTIFKLK
jgi:hypothetical protein